MQMPNILQGFGLEIIMIAEITYLWFQSLKNRKTPTLSAFFRLCTALMLFLLINIPVRITDLHLAKWDQKIIFLINAVYIALQTLTIYEWFVYFLAVQGDGLSGKPKTRLIISIPLDVTILLLAVSYKTHWLFYVDENGLYTRGSLFFLQVLIPYLYLFGSFVSAVIAYRRNKNKRMFMIFLSAFCISVGTAVLQVFFSGSFSHAGLCCVVLLLYLEMYQYEIKQIDQMRSLGAVNRELEAVNAKLNETIEELKISVANEKAANNAKNDFLSRMSHDIRTPLNGILGIIEIDDRHSDDIELMAANRKKAKVAARHLLSLLNDVLDMSKLASGKLELSHEPFVMSQLISEVSEIAAPAAAEKGVTLIREINDDTDKSLTTYGSPLHITRALLNIVGNAVKYNRKGGSVTVRLEHSPIVNDQIGYIVTISDTGIGMNEKYIQTLFDPFSQERIDARSVYEGSGLGMAITKALIDKMGGTIEITSKEGEGSTFVIRLRFEIAADPGSCAAASGEEYDLAGLRILLAEDNELNSEIAVSLLEDFGAIVDLAENGKIAFVKFRDAPQGTYDVILMDCMMPLMDGFEATKAIRALENPDAGTVPIIAMTANAFADDVKKCLDSGMNDHLPKPFEIGKVTTAIKKHIASRKN